MKMFLVTVLVFSVLQVLGLYDILIWLVAVLTSAAIWLGIPGE